MVDCEISPSQFQGVLRVPPSKSHTMRALVFALMAQGTSIIENPLSSPDTDAMIQGISLLGARVTRSTHTLIIEGVGGKLAKASTPIDCGNSGQVLRFLGALAALSPYETHFTGDLSLRTLRPAKPLLTGLRQLGAAAVSSYGNDYAPFSIQGPLVSGQATVDGADSQPISGLILAAAFAQGPTDLYVTNPGEKPWIDLTLWWLDRFHIPYRRHGYCHYHLPGSAVCRPFHYTVPGDFSSAAYPMAAAIVTHSPLTVENLDMNDAQGDKCLISVLQAMGADLHVDHSNHTIHVGMGHRLRGASVDVDGMIDATPLLAVLGTFAQGTTEITGGAMARCKECDRIAAITQELRKMGARIAERKDGLSIAESPLQGSVLATYRDHRIALSLFVAALGAKGPSLLSEVEVMDKSYPRFIQEMKRLGVSINYRQKFYL